MSLLRVEDNSRSVVKLGHYRSQGSAYDSDGGAVSNSAGLFVLAGGGFTINGTVTTTNVQLTGGALSGVNVLRGGFTWANGNWNSASSVTLSAGSELNIISAGDHDLVSCIFTNLGKVEWLAGRLRGGGLFPGTRVYNSGLWEVKCDQVFNSDFGVDGVVFNNLGTFRKLIATGTTAFSPNNSPATFNNLGGAIELSSGTLSLPHSFSQNGGALTIGLGGASPGQFGRLVANGSAILNSALNVTPANGLRPDSESNTRLFPAPASAARSAR